LAQEERRLTVLYSANFVFICPNCRKEQQQNAGRKQMVYKCPWCDREYKIKIAIHATDRDGNTFGD
jgi:ssDNA-binding Zn-finger/Zn-ribbon topoisomerase 1